MIDKLLKKNISNLKEKIDIRLKRNRLVFGNRIQLASLHVLENIDFLLNDAENYIECIYCGIKYNISQLHDINGEKICDSCESNHFYSCEGCGDMIHNDDIKILEPCGYCEACYFKEKQALYDDYTLKNKKLIALYRLCQKSKNFDILFDYEFKIDGNYWNIENHRNFFRLGSWGANSWIDIGKNKESLLQAIEYNLAKNISLLTDISKN